MAFDYNKYKSAVTGSPLSASSPLQEDGKLVKILKGTLRGANKLRKFIGATPKGIAGMFAFDHLLVPGVKSYYKHASKFLDKHMDYGSNLSADDMKRIEESFNNPNLKDLSKQQKWDIINQTNKKTKDKKSTLSDDEINTIVNWVQGNNK